MSEKAVFRQCAGPQATAPPVAPMQPDAIDCGPASTSGSRSNRPRAARPHGKTGPGPNKENRKTEAYEKEAA